MKSNYQLKSILLILFLFIFIAACKQEEPSGTPEPSEENAAPTEQATEEETTPPPSTQFVPLIVNENGLSLQYPANWVTHSASGGTTVASSQAVIDAESLADIGEDAFVVIIAGEIDVFNFQTSQNFTTDDIIQVLQTYKALLEKEGQVYVVVEPPQAFTNNNQNMARVILRSTEADQPIITVMAVIMGDSYIALVSAASSEDKAEEMRPIFYEIIDSIEVQAPGSFSSDG